MLKWVNSLPNDKNFNLFKLKAFVDDILHLARMTKYVFERVENIVGKGQNAGNQHFLLFPLCFQRASFTGSLKVGIVWYRVKCYLNNANVLCN